MGDYIIRTQYNMRQGTIDYEEATDPETADSEIKFLTMSLFGNDPIPHAYKDRKISVYYQQDAVVDFEGWMRMRRALNAGVIRIQPYELDDQQTLGGSSTRGAFLSYNYDTHTPRLDEGVGNVVGINFDQTTFILTTENTLTYQRGSGDDVITKRLSVDTTGQAAHDAIVDYLRRTPAAESGPVTEEIWDSTEINHPADTEIFMIDLFREQEMAYLLATSGEESEQLDIEIPRHSLGPSFKYDTDHDKVWVISRAADGQIVCNAFDRDDETGIRRARHSSNVIEVVSNPWFWTAKQTSSGLKVIDPALEENFDINDSQYVLINPFTREPIDKSHAVSFNLLEQAIQAPWGRGDDQQGLFALARFGYLEEASYVDIEKMAVHFDDDPGRDGMESSTKVELFLRRLFGQGKERFLDMSVAQETGLAQNAENTPPMVDLEYKEGESFQYYFYDGEPTSMSPLGGYQDNVHWTMAMYRNVMEAVYNPVDGEQHYAHTDLSPLRGIGDVDLDQDGLAEGRITFKQIHDYYPIYYNEDEDKVMLIHVLDQEVLHNDRGFTNIETREDLRNITIPEGFRRPTERELFNFSINDETLVYYYYADGRKYMLPSQDPASPGETHATKRVVYEGDREHLFYGRTADGGNDYPCIQIWKTDQPRHNPLSHLQTGQVDPISVRWDNPHPELRAFLDTGALGWIGVGQWVSPSQPAYLSHDELLEFIQYLGVMGLDTTAVQVMADAFDENGEPISAKQDFVENINGQPVTVTRRLYTIDFDRTTYESAVRGMDQALSDAEQAYGRYPPDDLLVQFDGTYGRVSVPVGQLRLYREYYQAILDENIARMAELQALVRASEEQAANMAWYQGAGMVLQTVGMGVTIFGMVVSIGVSVLMGGASLYVSYRFMQGFDEQMKMQRQSMGQFTEEDRIRMLDDTAPDFRQQYINEVAKSPDGRHPKVADMRTRECLELAEAIYDGMQKHGSGDPRSIALEAGGGAGKDFLVFTLVQTLETDVWPNGEPVYRGTERIEIPNTIENAEGKTVPDPAGGTHLETDTEYEARQRQESIMRELKEKLKIRKLSVERLYAGTSLQGMEENKFEVVMDWAREKWHLVYIEELAMNWGKGGNEFQGKPSFGDKVRAALGGDVMFLGTWAPEDRGKLIRNGQEERRWRFMYPKGMPEPDPVEAKRSLTRTINGYLQDKMNISDPAIQRDVSTFIDFILEEARKIYPDVQSPARYGRIFEEYKVEISRLLSAGDPQPLQSDKVRRFFAGRAKGDAAALKGQIEQGLGFLARQGINNQELMREFPAEWARDGIDIDRLTRDFSSTLDIRSPDSEAVRSGRVSAETPFEHLNRLKLVLKRIGFRVTAEMARNPAETFQQDPDSLSSRTRQHVSAEQKRLLLRELLLIYRYGAEAYHSDGTLAYDLETMQRQEPLFTSQERMTATLERAMRGVQVEEAQIREVIELYEGRVNANSPDFERVNQNILEKASRFIQGMQQAGGFEPGADERFVEFLKSEIKVSAAGMDPATGEAPASNPTIRKQLTAAERELARSFEGFFERFESHREAQEGESQTRRARWFRANFKSESKRKLARRVITKMLLEGYNAAVISELHRYMSEGLIPSTEFTEMLVFIDDALKSNDRVSINDFLRRIGINPNSTSAADVSYGGVESESFRRDLVLGPEVVQEGQREQDSIVRYERSTEGPTIETSETEALQRQVEEWFTETELRDPIRDLVSKMVEQGYSREVIDRFITEFSELEISKETKLETLRGFLTADGALDLAVVDGYLERQGWNVDRAQTEVALAELAEQRAIERDQLQRERLPYRLNARVLGTVLAPAFHDPSLEMLVEVFGQERVIQLGDVFIEIDRMPTSSHALRAAFPEAFFADKTQVESFWESFQSEIYRQRREEIVENLPRRSLTEMYQNFLEHYEGLEARDMEILYNEGVRYVQAQETEIQQRRAVELTQVTQGRTALEVRQEMYEYGERGLKWSEVHQVYTDADFKVQVDEWLAVGGDDVDQRLSRQEIRQRLNGDSVTQSREALIREFGVTPESRDALLLSALLEKGAERSQVRDIVTDLRRMPEAMRAPWEAVLNGYEGEGAKEHISRAAPLIASQASSVSSGGAGTTVPTEFDRTARTRHWSGLGFQGSQLERLIEAESLLFRDGLRVSLDSLFEARGLTETAESFQRTAFLNNVDRIVQAHQAVEQANAFERSSGGRPFTDAQKTELVWLLSSPEAWEAGLSRRARNPLLAALNPDSEVYPETAEQKREFVQRMSQEVRLDFGERTLADRAREFKNSVWGVGSGRGANLVALPIPLPVQPLQAADVYEELIWERMPAEHRSQTTRADLRMMAQGMATLELERSKEFSIEQKLLYPDKTAAEVVAEYRELYRSRVGAEAPASILAELERSWQPLQTPEEIASQDLTRATLDGLTEEVRSAQRTQIAADIIQISTDPEVDRVARDAKFLEQWNSNDILREAGLPSVEVRRFALEVAAIDLMLAEDIPFETGVGSDRRMLTPEEAQVRLDYMRETIQKALHTAQEMGDPVREEYWRHSLTQTELAADSYNDYLRSEGRLSRSSSLKVRAFHTAPSPFSAGPVGAQVVMALWIAGEVMIATSAQPCYSFTDRMSMVTQGTVHGAMGAAAFMGTHHTLKVAFEGLWNSGRKIVTDTARRRGVTMLTLSQGQPTIAYFLESKAFGAFARYAAVEVGSMWGAAAVIRTVGFLADHELQSELSFYNDSGSESLEEISQHAYLEVLGKMATVDLGMTIGMMGGAYAGASLGSMIFPGVGTVIGGALGGLIGMAATAHPLEHLYEELDHFDEAPLLREGLLDILEQVDSPVQFHFNDVGAADWLQDIRESEANYGYRQYSQAMKALTCRLGYGFEIFLAQVGAELPDHPEIYQRLKSIKDMTLLEAFAALGVTDINIDLQNFTDKALFGLLASAAKRDGPKSLSISSIKKTIPHADGIMAYFNVNIEVKEGPHTGLWKDHLGVLLIEATALERQRSDIQTIVDAAEAGEEVDESYLDLSLESARSVAAQRFEEGNPIILDYEGLSGLLFDESASSYHRTLLRELIVALDAPTDMQQYVSADQADDALTKPWISWAMRGRRDLARYAGDWGRYLEGHADRLAGKYGLNVTVQTLEDGTEVKLFDAERSEPYDFETQAENDLDIFDYDGSERAEVIVYLLEAIEEFRWNKIRFYDMPESYIVENYHEAVYQPLLAYHGPEDLERLGIPENITGIEEFPSQFSRLDQFFEIYAQDHPPESLRPEVTPQLLDAIRLSDSLQQLESSAVTVENSVSDVDYDDVLTAVELAWKIPGHVRRSQSDEFRARRDGAGEYQETLVPALEQLFIHEDQNAPHIKGYQARAIIALQQHMIRNPDMKDRLVEAYGLDWEFFSQLEEGDLHGVPVLRPGPGTHWYTARADERLGPFLHAFADEHRQLGEVVASYQDAVESGDFSTASDAIDVIDAWGYHRYAAFLSSEIQDDVDHRLEVMASDRTMSSVRGTRNDISISAEQDMWSDRLAAYACYLFFVRGVAGQDLYEHWRTILQGSGFEFEGRDEFVETILAESMDKFRSEFGYEDMVALLESEHINDVPGIKRRIEQFGVRQVWDAWQRYYDTGRTEQIYDEGRLLGEIPLPSFKSEWENGRRTSQSNFHEVAESIESFGDGDGYEAWVAMSSSDFRDLYTYLNNTDLSGFDDLTGPIRWNPGKIVAQMRRIDPRIEQILDGDHVFQGLLSQPLDEVELEISWQTQRVFVALAIEEIVDYLDDIAELRGDRSQRREERRAMLAAAREAEAQQESEREGREESYRIAWVSSISELDSHFESELDHPSEEELIDGFLKRYTPQIALMALAQDLNVESPDEELEQVIVATFLGYDDPTLLVDPEIRAEILEWTRYYLDDQQLMHEEIADMIADDVAFSDWIIDAYESVSSS